MTRRIGLALTLHNHQPVGNFGWVIAETYERAYLPMLDALDRHAGVNVALHYTGPLLSWLRVERPDFLKRLAALVARGQVEIVGGGWYEPVLASLHERDRIAQLRRMADELEGQFGIRPQGAWLAERVWEPDLPTALVDGGYRWTILDDAHFRAAAIPEAWVTAFDALITRGRLRSGERLLVHAIGSGVGTAALQLAHATGAHAVGTGRTQGKLDRCTRELGLKPRARFHTFAVSGADPILMLTAVIPATQQALTKAGLGLSDIDVVEINEAFASVVLAWKKELGADDEWFEKNVNPNGGAIAIGHPLGASGGRLMTTLLHEMERRGARYGLQTMCEGGGMANATILERLD